MDNKVVVAHPAKQHSYQTGIALKKFGILDKYVTTIYYNSNSFFYKLLDNILPKRFANKIKTKCDRELDDYVETHCSMLGFIFLVLMNIDIKKRVVPYFHILLSDLFSAKVAKKINRDNCACIIGYDSHSTRLFSNVIGPVKILDMTSIPAKNIHDILQSEYNKLSSDALYKTDLENKLRFYSEKNCYYFQKECELADYIFVSSTHQRDFLIRDGIKSERIKTIKYGMNFRGTLDNIDRKGTNTTFLFVGRVESAKGIYYLLEAFLKICKVRTDWNLQLVGECCLSEKLIKERYPFCNIIGKVDKNEMPSYYMSADVFVLPSLWEGLSLSLLEAMSFGLPAIATDVSGGEDIIKDYDNGILVKPHETECLVDAITWFLNNKEKLSEMRKNAYNSCLDYTWDNYSISLNRAINSIVDIRNRRKEK